LQSKKILTFFLPALVVIGFDRFTKYLVRTTPAMQHWTVAPGWLNFHYTQNPGMAMGFHRIPVLNIHISTVAVSIISIIATVAIIVYVLYTIVNARLGFLFFMGMIVGGAIGNIIDRLIMAYIGGYGGIFQGHVVDFIQFSAMINGYLVFPYIFNFADASITTAIIALLIFNRQLLPERAGNEEKKTAVGISHEQ
jgi:signal peptidase II